MENGFNLFNGISDEARNIFSLIQKNGAQTKNDISLIANVKLTTLNRIMQPLEESGLLVQARIGESTGGRKPVLYDVNTNRYCIAGIDISRIYTQVVITNLKMDVLYKQQFSMEAHCSPQKTVKLISGVLDEALIQLNIDAEMLIGVGLGTVGPLDREKGVMINPANFEAPGWINAPIKAMLEAELGRTVIVDNGANAAVLAEILFGRGRNFKNVVYFNCGVGIRTGAVSAGNIVRTINDAEDAFGHMVIDVDGEACGCGNFGCIECYSSIVSITRRFASELKKGRSSSVPKDGNDINYIDICSAAESNDYLAKEVITGSAVVLGTGLANFINILNPGLVILSGPMIKHSKLFYDVCTEVASKKCYSNKEGGIAFARGGDFEENAIAVGSAALVVENYLGSKILGL